MQQRMMEQANWEEQELRKEQQQAAHMVIRDQREEQRQKVLDEKADRMGAISSEFFNNFGKSCR